TQYLAKGAAFHAKQQCPAFQVSWHTKATGDIRTESLWRRCKSAPRCPVARCGRSRRRRPRPRGGRCRRSKSRGRSSGAPPAPAGLLALLADYAVERLDDLQDADVLRRAGERVPALRPPVAGEDARSPERGEELLQELHGDPPALGDLADRHRVRARARQFG